MSIVKTELQAEEEKTARPKRGKRAAAQGGIKSEPTTVKDESSAFEIRDNSTTTKIEPEDEVDSKLKQPKKRSLRDSVQIKKEKTSLLDASKVKSELDSERSGRSSYIKSEYLSSSEGESVESDGTVIKTEKSTKRR